MRNLSAERLFELSQQFVGVPDHISGFTIRAEILREVLNFPSWMAYHNIVRFALYLPTDHDRGHLTRLLEKQAARYERESNPLRDLVERAVSASVEKIAITTDTRTGEIVGIHVAFEDHGEGMGVQTVVDNGLVNWTDLDGKPYWGQGDGTGSVHGIYRAQWINTHDLLDRLLAS